MGERFPGLGVTIVFCTALDCGQGPAVRDPLAAAVRAHPHAVLISAACPLGKALCRTRAKIPGPRAPFLLAQRCLGQERRPIGGGLLIGPLHDDADVAAVCDWLASPDLDPHRLPERLNPARRSARAVLN